MDKQLLSDSQSVEASSLGVLEVEGVRENMAATIFSKDNRSLPSGTHLTIEAPDTSLAYDTVELRLLWILTTNVTDLSLRIIRDETRLIWRD